MQTVIVNSRGLARPTRLYKTQGDRTPVVFDFSLLLGDLSSYEVKGDMPTTSSSLDGGRVTVNLDAGQECRLYDLTVNAANDTEAREVTVQVKVQERERGWNAEGCAGGGYC